MPIPSNSWCSNVDPCPLIANTGLSSCIPKTAGTAEQALDLFGPWQQENLHTGFGLIQSRDLLAQNLSSNISAAPHPGGAGGSVS